MKRGTRKKQKMSARPRVQDDSSTFLLSFSRKLQTIKIQFVIAGPEMDVNRHFQGKGKKLLPTLSIHTKILVLHDNEVLRFY